MQNLRIKVSLIVSGLALLATGTTMAGFALAEADQAGPMVRDQAGPMVRDQAGPMVRDQAGPMVRAGDGPKRGHRGPRLPIDLSAVQAKVSERFAGADADGNGLITLDEFNAADARPGRDMRRRASRMRQGPMAGGPRPHRDGNPEADSDKAQSRADRAQLRAEVEAAVFELLDSDGSGELSAEEFAPEKHHAAMKTVMKTKQFERMDRDGDGYLGESEFAPQLTRLKALDGDGDGQVTREEMRSGRLASHGDQG